MKRLSSYGPHLNDGGLLVFIALMMTFFRGTPSLFGLHRPNGDLFLEIVYWFGYEVDELPLLGHLPKFDDVSSFKIVTLPSTTL